MYTLISKITGINTYIYETGKPIHRIKILDNTKEYQLLLHSLNHACTVVYPGGLYKGGLV